MNRGLLRTRIEQFTAFDLDNFLGEDPSEADFDALINWSIRAVSDYTRCNYDHKIVLTLVAGTHVTDCRDITTPAVSRKVLEPRLVTINSGFLRNPRGERGLWTLSELEANYPGYQTYDNGKSARAIWLPNNQLLLSAPPSSVVVSDGNNFISGWYLAADIATSDTALPDIPEELHEVLVYFAAFHASLPSVSEQEGWARLKSYNAEYEALVKRYRTTYLNLLTGPMVERGMSPDWM